MLSLFATSGLAQEVRYGFDRSADFSKYKTYKWVHITDSEQLGQLADQQLKTAIGSNLAKKGLANVEGEADLFVAYQTATNHETRFFSYISGLGADWAYSPGGGKSAFEQTSTIHIGAVGFDMYDAAKQRLVWRGEVSKNLDANAPRDRQRKNLEQAIAKLLKNYPPPPVKVKHATQPNNQTAH